MLLRLFFCFAFLSSGVSASAQNIIDEDFLDNIEANAKPLWDENTSDFSNTVVPDKYSGESAVIIGFMRSVNIDKKSRTGFLSKGERSLIFFEKVRFKIKLNDRNSVKVFTEVYFRYNDKTDGYSARIIKPSGEIKQVVLDDAVKLESNNEVPEFYKSFFDQQYGEQRNYYKVAIPDLQPGDILEYVTITKSKLDVQGTGYIEFTPQYEICSKGYPVLYNQIVIETDEKSFFKSSSLNGAPLFKKEPAGDPEFSRYVFTDRDRPTEKDINFVNKLQLYPLVKFQVIYANNEKVKGALIGNKGEIKSSFTKEELARKAWEDYEKVGDEHYMMFRGSFMSVQKVIDNIWAELKRLGATGWTVSDFVDRCYYRVRNIVVMRDNYLSDKVAAFIFGSLLYQRDIKSELIICASGSTGKMSNILFNQEIRYVVKADDRYFYNCTDHSNPGEEPDDLLGAEGYIIYQPIGKTGVQEIVPVKLPDEPFDKNTTSYTVNAELDKEMKRVVVSKTTLCAGINKNKEVNDALRFTTYMLDDYRNYGGRNYFDSYNFYQQSEYNKYVSSLTEEFKKAKKEFVRRGLQEEFSQKVTYKDFKIVSDGRTPGNTKLEFTEEFELGDMIRKAGRKYLVNIPGLVGSQLQIKNEEKKDRKYDIYTGYGRTLSWVINFKIPEGYTAEGLKELNTKTENETGSYSCSAEIKNNTVVINISKIYKKAFLPKEKWPDMISFVEAAFNNSFRYILLKPKTD